MIEGIKALIHNPHTHLKFFENGVFCYPNSTIQIPTKEERLLLQTKLQNNYQIQNEEIFVEILVGILCQENLVDRIVETQKRDQLGIQKIASFHSQLQNLTLNQIQEALRNGDQSFQNQLEAINDFLIATAARDCSILISLVLANEGEIGKEKEKEKEKFNLKVFWDKKRNQTYFYKIGLVDLDWKSPQKIEFYSKQDKEILEHYLNLNPNRDLLNCASHRQLQSNEKKELLS